MIKYEVWIWTGGNHIKEVIEAESIREVALLIREEYRGNHRGFFIMPARRKIKRGLPPNKWGPEGGKEYQEAFEQEGLVVNH